MQVELNTFDSKNPDVLLPVLLSMIPSLLDPLGISPPPGLVCDLYELLIGVESQASKLMYSKFRQ
jgi:hypothetical protein